MKDSFAKTVKESMQMLQVVYQDLAQPGVKQVGLAIENILGLTNVATLPIKAWNEKKLLVFEQNMSNLRSKFQNTDENEIINVPPEIGVPILDKFTYITNDDISNLFANLLATASISSSAHLGHPGFLKTIENISVDEAKIIEYFSKQNSEYIPLIYFLAHFNTGDGSASRKVSSNLIGCEFAIELIFSENMELYLDNLETLGIISCYQDDVLTPKDLYSDVESKYSGFEQQLYTKFIESKQYNLLTVQQGHYKLTDYGKSFIDACISPASTRDEFFEM